MGRPGRQHRVEGPCHELFRKRIVYGTPPKRPSDEQTQPSQTVPVLRLTYDDKNGPVPVGCRLRQSPRKPATSRTFFA